MTIHDPYYATDPNITSTSSALKLWHDANCLLATGAFAATVCSFGIVAGAGTVIRALAELGLPENGWNGVSDRPLTGVRAFADGLGALLEHAGRPIGWSVQYLSENNHRSTVIKTNRLRAEQTAALAKG